MLHPRVVDHDVDVEVEVGDGIQIGQIGDHCQRPDLVCDGFGGDVTVEDGHTGTGVGEGDSDRPADPGGPTGHECASPSQRLRILVRGWGHALDASGGSTGPAWCGSTHFGRKQWWSWSWSSHRHADR